MSDNRTKLVWKPQVRDLKLLACLEYSHSSLVTPEIKTKALEIVVKAFRYNVAGIRMMMQSLAHVGEFAMRLQKCLDLAEYQITGRVTRDSSSQFAPKPIADLFHKLWDEITEQDAKLLGTPAWDPHAIEGLKRGLDPVIILGNSAPPAEFRAIFSSYLIATWTAFETMAGDLWEAALNINPHGLAHLKGKARRKNDKQPFGAAKKPKKETESKSIDLDLIQFHQFDLRKKMGTILRSRYEFSRLPKIREAYAAAFDRDSSKIDAALDHNSLDSLSAVRNVLVHKAGFVDAEYLRRSQYLNVPKGNLGELIHLDGEIAVGIIKPAIVHAASLIEAVDDWLDKHK